MAIRRPIRSEVSKLALLSLLTSSLAFLPSPLPIAQRNLMSLRAHEDNTSHEPLSITNAIQSLTTTITAFTILSLPISTPLAPSIIIANADEWGIETEAPTLFTGETTMICKKRGPLGACIETAVRTSQNDNDKSLQYFKDPSEEVKKRQAVSIKGSKDEEEGNELILRLRRLSEENKERNDNEVRVKTLMNDQGASFGPFDRQVVILNTDGKTFTLLENPQAMRLKKAGYIGKDRKFIIQPSQEVIDGALEGKNDLGDAIKGFFGGSGNDQNTAEVALSADVIEEKLLSPTDAFNANEDTTTE